ncbi:uncharacterized protein Z518_01084 [Rhinocladiella mackenziei CBS 650.93]|uniref:Uncharacterized protein n=1 Tax=Rhinocladiella mackenziei CBS 650.93 TaxID=1442369 RepID=A0A0D2HHB6_9EURO|nr:uncharacterized protein Z518_01084 [Rhinocladiella mackenziei CBS 650.93]KIX10003.1 hypothetical protein Z518_01084 [Rhinocladiella mackenziei CBS 650.93]
MAQSGPNSGGDLFDMATDEIKVPESAAEPRYIPSKPRPDQGASASDPNDLGGQSMAEAATNEGDISRTTRDTAPNDVLTGTGDSLPSQVDSKRLHSVPGGVTHDPSTKGSTRMTKHTKQQSDFVTGASEGPWTDRIPGQEGISDEEAMDNIERRA